MSDPQQSLAALLDCAPFHVDLTVFARDHALAASEVDTMAERLGLVRASAADGVFAFSTTTWATLRRNLAEALERFHAANTELPGIAPERLRVRLEPRLPARAMSAVIEALVREQVIAFEGGCVRLPGHRINLTAPDEQLWSKIAPLLSGAERFRPPRGVDLARLLNIPEAAVRRVLKSLARQGEVIEIAPDHFFLRATAAEMVDIAADIAATSTDGQLTAAQFRDRLDNGRKVAIQILEFFDRQGVTIRRGDLRRMNPQRLGLFRRAGAFSGKVATGFPSENATTHEEVL